MSKKRQYPDSVKTISHIVLSFLLSVVFIWVFSYLFNNSELSYEYDSTLKKYVQEPGVIYRHRKEGWAQTYKGKFGINAIEDITKDSRDKIIIWGDSYVEAHQVNDNEKIPQVLTSLFKDNSLDNLMSFGVGMSGDSVADYYFDIPKYEKLASSVKAHFIIITSLEDIMPDQQRDTIRGVFKSKPYRMEDVAWQPEYQGIKRVISKYDINFVWEPVKSIMSNKTFHFIPAVNNKSLNVTEISETVSNEFFKESCEFTFKKLLEQTDLPIIFVYCPVVPEIQNGEVIFEDPNDKYIRLFTEEALKYNIGIIDMRSSFIKYYLTSNQLPVGFQNYKPGYGHFNTAGHKLIAEELFKYIKRELDI